MRYFDYEKVAQEANIPSDKLDELRQLVRKEFPKDEMLYELHLLRACMAIKKGLVTINDAVQEEKKVVEKHL